MSSKAGNQAAGRALALPPGGWRVMWLTIPMPSLNIMSGFEERFFGAPKIAGG